MGGGGKSKSTYKNPYQITTSVQGVFIGAIKGYANVGDLTGVDLAIDEFMETVRIESEKANLSNIGHPLYRPYLNRRFGFNVGLPARQGLAYDNVSTRYLALRQLEEEGRVFASATYNLMDEFDIDVGDTIAIEDITMGVRRLFLVEGITESDQGVELNLLDVLGG